MRIAFFSTHTTWVTHLETELEIAQDFLKVNAKVDFYSCNDSSFKCCENILSRSLLDKINYNEISNLNCHFCISRQNRGFDLIDGDINKYPLINNNQKEMDYIINDSFFESHEALKNLYYDNDYDIGWSILSSFVSYTRDPFINLKEYKGQIQLLYSDSIRVYETAKKAILNNKYDRIYVFNGRVSYTRGLYRLGIKLKVPTYVHERGSIPEKYEIFENTTPHNISSYFSRVNSYWNRANFITKFYQGKKFYKDKVNGFSGSWVSFTSNFEKNKLPEKFNFNQTNIVLYTSSEDEFFAIDDTWDNPYFNNQLEGIEYLCRVIDSNDYKNTNLYIRIHPNSKFIDINYLNKLYSFSRYKNVIIIPPDSKINSYSLLFSSNKVITFGSTITFEAIYWGKPVVLLSRCEFAKFKGPTIPLKFEDIKALCFDENLPTPLKTDALKIGYYLRSYGKSYKYYKALDYIKGYFKGIDLSSGQASIIPETKLTTRINKLKRRFYPIYKFINKYFS